MKKSSLLLILTAAFGVLIFYLLWSGRWFERIFDFASSQPQGKSWNTELGKFQKLYPEDSSECIFLGDSHIEQCEWHELLPECKTANRGIGGESIDGLIIRLNEKATGEIVGNYGQILDTLARRNFRVVPTLVFPLRYLPELNAQLEVINKGIRKHAGKHHFDVIDINLQLLEAGVLNRKYSDDGIHLNSDGYQIWLSEIRRNLNLAKDSCCR
jgi:hypothetical protein